MVKHTIPSRLAPGLRRESKSGFTLVEMLTVIGIAAILAVLAASALPSLQKAGGFNKSVYSMADLLGFARTYALANNTYVYVGLTEVDRTQSTSAVPQTTAIPNSTGGRVAMAIVASQDGTNNYNTSTNALTVTNLLQVRPTQVFDFLHIAKSASTTGNMARTTEFTNSTSIYNLGADVSTTPSPSFSVPIGGTAKYNFTVPVSWVIVINPQGNMLLFVTTSGTAYPTQYQFLEIDFQPFSGTLTATAAQANQAALVINGTTGATTVYRP